MPACARLSVCLAAARSCCDPLPAAQLDLFRGLTVNGFLNLSSEPNLQISGKSSLMVRLFWGHPSSAVHCWALLADVSEWLLQFKPFPV